MSTECFLDPLRNGTISRLSMQVGLYGLSVRPALISLRRSPPSMGWHTIPFTRHRRSWLLPFPRWVLGSLSISLLNLAQTWTAHFQTKQRHFEAAAQVRKSMDDSENGRSVSIPGLRILLHPKCRYGSELGRLASARAFARQGQESARRGVADLVVEDITVSINTRFLGPYLWILLGSWQLD